MGNKVELSAALNLSRVAAGQGNLVYLLIKIKGEQLEKADRLPLNLSFVMDRSGSMGGGKIEHTRQALALCINSLDQRDIQSLVIFDNEVEVLITPQAVANKDLAKKIIQGIEARGTTNFSGGLLKGAKLVEQSLQEGRVNRIITLTDGLANEGIQDVKGLTELAANIAKRGMALTCIGVGDDFNEDLLTAMAEAGRGNFYYIDNPDRIPAIFQEELEGLLQVIGQGMEMTIKLDNASLQAVYGYQPVTAENGLVFSLPDLYSGEEKILMLELKVQGLSSGFHRIADIWLSYLDAEECREQTVDIPVDIWAGQAEEIVGEEPDVEVESQARRFKVASVQQQAINLADAGDFDQARSLIMNTISTFSACAVGDEVLADSLRELEQNSSVMEEASFNASVRKNMQYSSHEKIKSRRKRS